MTLAFRRPTVFTGQSRLAGLLLIAGGIAACKMDTSSVCVLGPCDTTGGSTPTPVVAGFPVGRVSGNAGHLAPGDTVTLHAVRVGLAVPPCTVADTLRTNVLWGVSDTTVATITPLPDGGVRVRAISPGSFQMLMREGGSAPLSGIFDAKNVFPCPSDLQASFSSIVVAP
jgi:hypothetical protein